MLQDEIGSIMKFCYDQCPVKIYVDRIPQGMVIPCLYFPAPNVLSSGGTIGTYRNSYQLFAKVFYKKTQQAHDQAHSIAEAIRRARGIIPLVSVEGSTTGKWMLLSLDLQTKPVDDGVAQITIKWDSWYPYDREDFPMMETLSFIGRVKTG